MAILYTLVPLTFFYQYSKGAIKRNKTSILGLLFLYLNGLTYFVITLKQGINNERDMRLRDFSNLSGAILGFGYCLYFAYIIYFKDNQKKFIIFLIIIFSSFALMILLVILVSAKILEYIGIIFNIFEYLPLGFDLFYLIHHKIGERYLFFSAVPGIINTIIWIIWASIKVANEGEKYHSLISNILGFLLCVTQIIIIFIFKSDDYIGESLIENKNIKEDKSTEKRENSSFEDFL